MYRQLFGFALCVCFVAWLPGIIDCQAPVAGDADAGVRVPGVDVPGEPVLIEKEEMEKEMEVAEKKENQRKLEEGDEFEVIDHEKDEELREKGNAEKQEDLKVQVLRYYIYNSQHRAIRGVKWHIFSHAIVTGLGYRYQEYLTTIELTKI